MVKFKIAMIYETVKVATEDEELSHERLVISEESMRQAIAATTYYFRVITYLIKENFAINRYAGKIAKAVSVLGENKGLLNSRLLQKQLGKVSAQDFQKIIQAGEQKRHWVITEEKSSAGRTQKLVKLL